MRLAQWHPRIHEVLVVTDKSIPLGVLRHHNGPGAEAFDRLVRFVGLALENACVGIVGFLNLADHDRLELSARVFQVEEGLGSLATNHWSEDAETYLVEIVLLIDLPFNLPLNGQSHDKRIAPAGCRTRIRVD